MSDEGVNREVDELRLRNSFGPLLTSEPRWAAQVLEGADSSAYEAIVCVGLQPDQSSLYATIEIKQDQGYGGDLGTGPGSREYVRFFADWDGDGDFADADGDLGLASVAVHDLPGPKPLHYAVAVTVPEHRRLCFLAGPVAVRAVLMYGAIPPAGNPDPRLNWGDIVDVHVQPLTRHLLLLDVIEQAELSLPEQLLTLVDQHAEVSAPQVTQTVESLLGTYGDAVPLHRTLAPQLSSAVRALADNASLQATLAGQFSAVLSARTLDRIDLPALIGAYLGLGCDSQYEQLEGVGLSQDLSAVVATLRLNASTGYAGGLCTTGSVEYVAFWADWDDDGIFDSYLGTAAVTVHDEALPAGGLMYAARLPVDLASQQRPCGTGHTARIRAVLSWTTPPSTTNPYAPPVWGDAVEAFVPLPVGQPVVGLVPFLSVVGSMAVADIDAAGFASGVAVGPGFSAVNAPFAGSVLLAGHLSGRPDVSSGRPLTYGLRYRQDSEPAGSYHEITNTFEVSLSRWSGSGWTSSAQTQVADPVTHRYPYLENLAPGGDQSFVADFLLGRWLPAALPDGRYEVWLVADIGGSPVDSNHVWVRLDNTPPTGHLIGSGGHVSVPVGGTLAGMFDVEDEHLGSWSLGVLPTFPDRPVPFGGTSNVPAGTGFSLSTVSSVPGGYVLMLTAVDRAIVDSASIGQTFNALLGFCVEGP